MYLHFNIISVLTDDHFSRDTHMRIILGNKAVIKKSTSDSKYILYYHDIYILFNDYYVNFYNILF